MPRIFISYRREDTSPLARLVFTELEKTYGRDEIFMDVDAIPPGADFVTEIERVIGESDVVLALVGRHWAVSEDGRRRLDDPKDFVRQEVAAAIAAWRAKETHLIPVLAPGSPVPKEEDLPAELRGFERINAVKLSDDYWNASIDALLKSVAGALTPADAPLSPPPERRTPRAWERPTVTAPSELAPPPLHFDTVAHRIAHGRVVFFLGPGVNYSDRPPSAFWKPGGSFLPTASELATYLAEVLHLDELLDLGAEARDLVTIADYVETMLGEAPMYDVLRSVFAVDYPPSTVHLALARLPQLVRDPRRPRRPVRHAQLRRPARTSASRAG